MQNQNLPQTLEITFKDLPIIIHALEKEADYCKGDAKRVNYWDRSQTLLIIGTASINYVSTLLTG